MMKPNMEEVTCIIPPDDNGDDRINGIGGWTGSKVWTLSRDEAIAKMENTYFYVKDKNHQPAQILVKTFDDGRDYLTTAPDDSQENNLENLPSCDEYRIDLAASYLSRTSRQLPPDSGTK